MLIISSTFTVVPIKKPLMWFLEKFDFFKKQEIRFASYNQVFQELENHHSLSAQNIGGINVFIIKLDDFVRFQRNISNQNDVITIMRREMHRLSESLVFQAQSMDTTSFIVAICHGTDITMKKFGFGNDYTKLHNNIVDSLRTKLAGISNIHLILEQDIAQILPIDNYHDPIADEEGHIPYVFEYYNALGYLLARKIFDIALLVHMPLKAIILDCDNTLWKGICGEVGAENIEVAASYRFLQHFMKDQKVKGVLLCLCSKNNEKDVLDVFNCNTISMVLKLEDIAAYRINWNSKTSNVRELLDFLGFSEQNVVFIDDREDECREVQENFPDLLTIQLPEENNIPSFLKNLWVFDHIKQITAEDRNRTSIYREKFYLNSNVKSDSVGALNQSSSDAIVSLIELNAENIEFSIIQRAADLTSRTNQFNLAKKIYSGSQITSFIEKKNFCVLLADVKDNHGNDYGLTGLIIFRISDKNLIVDTFLLSCRVIGKNLERMMLSRLVEVAKQNNLTSISIPFIPTDRNKPAEYFLRSIVNIYEKNNSTELEKKNSNETLRLYLLDINQDTQVEYRQLALEVAKPSKIIGKLELPNAYNLAIIGIARNYETYLNDSKQNVMSVQDVDCVENLFCMLNKICRKKISSSDASFVASGIDSFELMMFLAQIYRCYKVKIELLEVQELDNINTLAKVVQQKIGSATEAISQESMISSDLLSLSSAQEALWLERLKMRDDSPYNLFRVFYLKGKLDLLKLENIFKTIIAKHESLRTAFLAQDSSRLPVRKIFNPEDISFKLQVEKIHAINLDVVTNAVHSLVQKPFELESPPMMRVHLIITAPDEYYLLITMHHIICDGWSFSKLIDEVNRVYNDGHSQLIEEADSALSYSRFVKWQQEQIPLVSTVNAEFLQKHFLNYPAMNLPYDFSKPKTISYQGQHISFEIDHELTSKLHQIAMQCKATLYETMLSIYMIFLAKLCSQTDVSLASVITVRPQEYFDTIGYMVNLVTMRSDVSSNPGFLDFLEKTKLYFQKVRKTSDLPFLEIVKKYRDCFESIADLTRALFVFENFPPHELSLNNLQAQEIYCGNYLTLSLPNTSKFDLVFYFKEKENTAGNKIDAVVKFSTDVFKPETVTTFVERFKQISQSIAENVNAPILSHSLLTDKEKAILAVWNQSVKKDFPQESTVLKLFLDQAHRDPHKIALVEEDGKTITYDELNAATNKRALYLQSIGINKADIVAVTLERSIEMISNLVAIAKLGAIYLAIDPAYPLERRKYLCDDAKAKLHIDRPLDVSHIEEKPDIISQDIIGYDGFYVVYTSGSTGKPKGIITTNLAFCNLLHWFWHYYKLSPETNTALVASEGFDAFGWQLWPYLACGATIYIVSKKTFLDTEKFIEFINKNNISICFVPTVYAEILICEGHLDKFKTLEYLLTGGDKLNAFLPKPYSFKLMNHYGLSESAVVSTFCEIPFIEKDILEKLPYDKPLIGKPIDNTEIYILDSNQQQVPIGVWGELCIGGLGVASGYLNDQVLSAQKFAKNNFSLDVDQRGILYRTGDKARFLHDGNIEYSDRLDNQIEMHGYRIEPSEIEALILENIMVNQAVVVLHDNDKSKQLIAYVTLKNGADSLVDTSILIDDLKKSLPSKMIPKHVIVLDKLPITKNGKIDRASLIKKSVLMQASVNTENKVYNDIINIFSELLNESQEKFNINKSFFDLGGDSIGILKLLNTVKRKFNVNISVSEVYNAGSSVSSLASLISKRQLQGDIMTRYDTSTCPVANASNSLVVLRAGDSSQMPLFFIHPVGGTVFCYQKLVDHLDKDQTCYGIQYPLDSQYGANLPKSIQELATFYIDPIRSAQPKGPYAIVGHSFGGMLTYEIAYQLSNLGEKVALIAILDTWVVNVLDKQKKQKLKRDIIQKYQDQYESVFVENPMAETRFVHMQNIGFVYQPPRFTGEINLFKAEIQVSELSDIRDDTNFWSEFVKTNVHSVPGDHDSMLETGNVQQLADKLTASISSAKIKGG